MNHKILPALAILAAACSVVMSAPVMIDTTIVPESAVSDTTTENTFRGLLIQAKEASLASACKLAGMRRLLGAKRCSTGEDEAKRREPPPMTAEEKYLAAEKYAKEQKANSKKYAQEHHMQLIEPQDMYNNWRDWKNDEFAVGEYAMSAETVGHPVSADCHYMGGDRAFDFTFDNFAFDIKSYIRYRFENAKMHIFKLDANGAKKSVK